MYIVFAEVVIGAAAAGRISLVSWADLIRGVATKIAIQNDDDKDESQTNKTPKDGSTSSRSNNY